MVNFPIKRATKLQRTTVLWYTAVNRENDGSHPSNISSYRLDFGFVSDDGQMSFPGRPIATETIRRLCKNIISYFWLWILHLKTVWYVHIIYCRSVSDWQQNQRRIGSWRRAIGGAPVDGNAAEVESDSTGRKGFATRIADQWIAEGNRNRFFN